MSDPHYYVLEPAVHAAAHSYKLRPDQVQLMVRHSARVTHLKGNRRYEQYLFMVTGDTVSYMATLEDAAKGPSVAASLVVQDLALGRPARGCAECEGGRIPAFDVCERCDGAQQGCEHCDKGLIKTTIPCPRCAGKPVKV